MNATAENGDIWTGEKQDGHWIYADKDGRLYESMEIPAYRIKMDNAHLIRIGNKTGIAPLTIAQP